MAFIDNEMAVVGDEVVRLPAAHQALNKRDVDYARRFPPPAADDFIPYDGDLNLLDGPKDRNLVHSFRCGMLLHGVDLAGLGGMTTMAHSEADVEQTVAAVAGTLQLLQADGLL